jgi:ubiquinone/menaquinone biosynthesis C-methylase UbiE
MSSTPHPYAMENDREAERLEKKTDERATIHQLQLTGLLPGMRGLDAGAGTGAVARTMAKLVGPQGSATAMDMSQERLRSGEQIAREDGLTNVSFVEGDLYSPPLPANSLDYIWSRFVFEYLSDPPRALTSLISLLKPGGKIVVGDLDGNGLFHFPMPPHVVSGLAKLEQALEGKIDLFVGRKLFHWFHAAGLQDIRVHMLPYHFYTGAIPSSELLNWELKFSTLRSTAEKALGGPEKYDAFVQGYMDMLKAPDSFTYSVLFLVEGRKGGPS